MCVCVCVCVCICSICNYAALKHVVRKDYVAAEQMYRCAGPRPPVCLPCVRACACVRACVCACVCACARSV